MDNKFCKKCQLDKSLDEFYKHNSSKDGYRFYCVSCTNDDNKKSYLRNRQNILKYQQEYRKDETVKQNRREWEKIWRTDPKVKKKRSNRESLRRKRDPIARMLFNFRTRISKVIKNNEKKGSAIKDLGCIGEELKTYIESKFYLNPITNEQMTWNNYGKTPNTWQIDHIEAFCLNDVKDRQTFLKIVNYKNLRPLWYEDHKIKSNKEMSVLKTTK